MFPGFCVCLLGTVNCGIGCRGKGHTPSRWVARSHRTLRLCKGLFRGHCRLPRAAHYSPMHVLRPPEHTWTSCPAASITVLSPIKHRYSHWYPGDKRWILDVTKHKSLRTIDTRGSSLGWERFPSVWGGTGGIYRSRQPWAAGGRVLPAGHLLSI